MTEPVEEAEATTTADKPYWRRYSDDRPPPGDQLAALRAGEGRDPFTVPSMWPFLSEMGEDAFSSPRRDGFEAPPAVVAEHHALVLFAVHQQSQGHLVHRKGESLGNAVKRLHTSDRFSKEAVDRRFYAMVTADDLKEMTHHLRGLIRQIRSLPTPVRLDYDQLVEDLRAWQSPFERDRVRRRWGRDYHLRVDKAASGGDPDPSNSTTN